jgi:hypothetical protein
VARRETAPVESNEDSTDNSFWNHVVEIREKKK